jgi:hypothetical protein
MIASLILLDAHGALRTFLDAAGDMRAHKRTNEQGDVRRSRVADSLS